MTEIYRGRRVRLREETREENELQKWSVILDHTILADVYSLEWANAFAEVLDGLVPPDVGHEHAMMATLTGLLTLAGAKPLIAGVLRRAADQNLARAHITDDPREAQRCRLAAQALAAQAQMLDGAA